MLASNTSSLSLTEIAAAATHPERVVGMHFFNPVHLMKLLEVVRAYQTTDATLERARARSGERMGKQLIVVRDRPASPRRRLGIAARASRRSGWWRRAWRPPRTSTGRWSWATATRWARSKLTDLVGLDVRLAIAEYLLPGAGESYLPASPAAQEDGEGG